MENNIGDISLNPQNAASVDGKLEVADNAETLKLKGDNHTFIGFYPQTNQRKAAMGFSTANDDNFTIENQASGGNVTISAGPDGGEVYIPSMLNLTGSKSITMTDKITFVRKPVYGHWGGFTDENWTKDFSLNCHQYIRAQGLHVFSDRRIKKNLRISNSQSDLNTLNQIEVTDYKHIDEIEHGSADTKGFIAQQIKKVYPKAISLATKVIPNIFAIPTQIQIQENAVQFTLDKKHDLAAGDKVKLVTKTGDQIQRVISTKDDFTFSVATDGIEEQDEVIVYGEEINDFHVVDYNSIYTLSISATQELARRVVRLETEIAKMKTENTQSIKTNNLLKAEVNSLSSRMEALEALLNTTSSN